MGRLGTQRLRPTKPPGRSGPLDRTAGGFGGAAPASLDLYGQSSIATQSTSRSGRLSLHLQVRKECYRRCKPRCFSGYCHDHELTNPKDLEALNLSSAADRIAVNSSRCRGEYFGSERRFRTSHSTERCGVDHQIDV